MRIIYINLDRGVERREWMEKQEGKLGLTFERLSAIDGAALTENPFPKVSLGASACFLSHRLIWSQIAKGNEDYVLVLEDDVHLSDELPKFLGDVSWIPPNSDIIHLERSTKFFITLRRDVIPALGRKLRRSLHNNTGTGAYIISRSCAIRLARDFTSIDREFDRILFDGGRPDLTIYKISPALGIQDKLTSSPRFSSHIDRAKAEPRARISGGKKVLREVRRLGRRLAEALGLTKTMRHRIEFK